MGRRDYYLLGTSNAICRVCGFKRKRNEMKLRWDGVWVCKEDWEIRQPQDFVRGVPEETKEEWTQPETPDTFVEITALAGGAGYLGGTAILDTNAQTVGVMYGNVVVGVPTIYVNGVLTATTYTQMGIVTLPSVPARGSLLAWSGVWLNNAGVTYTYSQFPFAIADGLNSTWQVYGVN